MMDPITRAMQRFADDAEAFWRAHPGRLLPLVAGDDDRPWVLQALRLREAAPDDRRPFVIHEAPFEATSTYFAALAEHYERVREGVAEEGVDRRARAAGRAARRCRRRRARGSSASWNQHHKIETRTEFEENSP